MQSKMKDFCQEKASDEPALSLDMVGPLFTD